MPVVAVAMAAGSFAAGATAMTAAVAAGTIGSMVAAGAVMVGSALTVVGTVTGNKNLAMIGGVLTLGGGLAGGMANPFGGTEGAAEGASAAGTTSALDTAGEAAGAADAASAAAAPVADSTGFVVDAAGNFAEPAGTGMLAQAAQATPVPASPEVAVAPLAEAPPPAPAPAPSAAPFQSSTPSAMSTPTLSKTSAFDTADLGGGLDQAFGTTSAYDPLVAGNQAPPLAVADRNLMNQTFAANGLSASGAPAPATLGGYFDKLGQWVEKNKALSEIGAKTAGGLLTNLVPSDKEAALTDYYQANAARTQADAERERIRQLWRSGRIA